MKNVFFTDFSGGLETNGSPTNIDINKSPDEGDFVVTPSGALTLRKGATKLMDQSASYGGKAITMLAPFEKSDGTKEVLVGYGGVVKKLNMSTGAVTDLPTPISGHSETAMYCAASYADELYFCNGVDAMVKYTGSANSNLTLTNDSGNAFKTNHFIFSGRKMWAVNYTNPLLVHRSKSDGGTASDIYTFNYSGGTVLENSGTSRLSDGGGVVHITAIDSLMYFFSKKKITTGDFKDFAGATSFVPDDVQIGVGGNNVDSCVDINNGVLFFDYTDRSIQQFGNIANHNTLVAKALSDNIRNLLGGVYDLSVSRGVYWQRKFLLACKSSPSAPTNDTVLLFDLESKGVFRIQNWYVNCWMVYEGELYYGSAITPIVYKAFDGTTDGGSIIPAYWKTKIEDYGAPNQYKNASLFYVEGTIDPDVKFDLTFNLDNGKQTVTKQIDGSNTDYVGVGPSTSVLGVGQVGVYQLGGIAVEGANEFRVWLRLNISSFQNFQVEVANAGSVGGGSIRKMGFIDPSIDPAGKIPSNRVI